MNSSEYNAGVRVRSLLALLLLCMAPLLRADDLLNNIRADYENKVLLIRGFYQDSRLDYDVSGMLARRGKTGSWSTSYMGISSLELRDDRLQLKGTRIAQIFDRTKRTFVAYQTRANIVINVDTGSSPTEDRVRKALSTVFVGSHEPLLPLLPDYWQWFFSQLENGVFPKEALAAGYKPRPCPESPAADDPCRVSKSVLPPKVISSPDPSYDKFAKQSRVEGVSVLGLEVDENGNPQRIRITSPVGFGLDDRAVEAVRRWRFSPAIRSGTPVPVKINVEVNFRLY